VFSGTSITSSMIGSAGPDLVMVPYQESSGGPARVYIVDGAKLAAAVSPADVVTTADVILPLPLDWKALPLQKNGLIRDLDGDGRGDFAIGENVTTEPGRIVVFW
jgi:hypothetical protein